MKQLSLPSRRLDCRAVLKAELAAALKKCGKSREQVLDELNEFLALDDAGQVSLATLEKWAAPSAAHMPPAHMLPYLCRVTGSTRILAALAEPLGAFIAGPREQRLMDLGEAQLLSQAANRKRRRALEELEGM